MKKTIKLVWKKKVNANSARVGMMYCFKTCDKNRN